MSSYAVMKENWMILSWVMLQSKGDRSLEHMDCCAAFRISNPGPQKQLHWDCWKTTEDLVAEATSGALHNTSASLSKFNSFILHSSAQDEVHDIVAGTDSQETSDGTSQDNPVGAVPILHFKPPIPASATAKEESHPLMDTDLRGVAPLPISCSPRAARTGGRPGSSPGPRPVDGPDESSHRWASG
ncbi:unnamed protein product [Gadus morhua 'NCC']